LENRDRDLRERDFETGMLMGVDLPQIKEQAASDLWIFSNVKDYT